MRGRTPESSPVQAPWRRTASLLGLVRSLGLLLSAPQMTFSSSFAILAVHPVQAPPSAIDSGRTSPFLLYWGRRDGNGGPLLDQHLQATMKRPQLMGERASEKIIVQPQRRQWRLKYSPKGWPSPPGSHRASKRVDTWGTMPLVHGAWSSPRALPASLGGLTKPVHMPLSQDHSKGPWEQGTLPEADPGPSVSPIFVFFFFFMFLPLVHIQAYVAFQMEASSAYISWSTGDHARERGHPKFCLWCVCCWWSEVKVTQSCLTLCAPMDYTVLGILQARILEWVVVPFSSGSSQPRDRTQVSGSAGRLFLSWAPREPCCRCRRGETQGACSLRSSQCLLILHAERLENWVKSDTRPNISYHLDHSLFFGKNAQVAGVALWPQPAPLSGSHALPPPPPERRAVTHGMALHMAVGFPEKILLICIR